MADGVGFSSQLSVKGWLYMIARWCNLFLIHELGRLQSVRRCLESAHRTPISMMAILCRVVGVAVLAVSATSRNHLADCTSDMLNIQGRTYWWCYLRLTFISTLAE